MYLIFGAAALGWSHASALASTVINYKSLSDTGVQFPVVEFKIMPGDKLQFEINAGDVSIPGYLWAKMWGKDFGYHTPAVKENEKKKICPFMEAESHEIEKLDLTHYRVTLKLPTAVIDAISKVGCAVTSPGDEKGGLKKDRSGKPAPGA